MPTRQIKESVCELQSFCVDADDRVVVLEDDDVNKAIRAHLLRARWQVVVRQLHLAVAMAAAVVVATVPRHVAFERPMLAWDVSWKQEGSCC